MLFPGGIKLVSRDWVIGRRVGAAGDVLSPSDECREPARTCVRRVTWQSAFGRNSGQYLGRSLPFGHPSAWASTASAHVHAEQRHHGMHLFFPEGRSRAGAGRGTKLGRCICQLASPSDQNKHPTAPPANVWLLPQTMSFLTPCFVLPRAGRSPRRPPYAPRKFSPMFLQLPRAGPSWPAIPP